MKKTEIDIINETVEYYKTNPRGISEASCEYITDEGAMCAVGRCLKNISKLKKQLVYVGDVFSLSEHFDGKIPFKKKYEEPSILFWKDLQQFHDEGSYWITDENSNNTLSELGKKELERLLNKYAN